MAKTVSEIMNHELFTVRPDEEADEVLGYLLSLGITAAPVVDPEHKALGVVSLRDLIRSDGREAFSRMSAPATTIPATASIEEAARRFAETGHHHLIAVDEDGRVVGFVGAIDTIRGLVGESASHPQTFPHYDYETGLVWTDEIPLALDRAGEAPDSPGLFQLVVGGAGKADTVVWSEATRNVRTRLIELLSVPQSAPPHLQDPIARGTVRFKAAAAPSARALTAAIGQLRESRGSGAAGD